jgi:hypothetical protein
VANFPTFLQAKAPRWLQNVYGARYLAALGGQIEVHVQRTRESVFARMPQFAPLDALPKIGTERGLPQGLSETTAAYRVRLQNAWQEWQQGGLYWGLLARLSEMGYPNVYICTELGQVAGPGATLTTSPAFTVINTGVALYTPYSYFTCLTPTQISDNLGAYWSNFVVIFYPVPGTWTNVVNPPTTSTAPTTNEVELIWSVINAWKPAFSFCSGVVADLSVAPARTFDFPSATFTGLVGNTFTALSGSSVIFTS